jgi:general secretion pathway protein G
MNPTRRPDRGFTLVEILIAIVLVGILSAVVVVGVSNLTQKGNTSACSASLDASKAAAAVYLTSTGAYPTTFDQMLTLTPPALTLPSGTAHTATTVGGGATGWTLTMAPGATPRSAPTFTCS